MLEPGWQENLFVDPFAWWTDPVAKTDPAGSVVISAAESAVDVAKSAGSWLDNKLNLLLIGGAVLALAYIYFNRRGGK